MIKEFSEILIVAESDLDRVVQDHQRRWVFRILAKKGVDMKQARELCPESGEINIRRWTDFLLIHDLDLLYDLGKSQAIFYFSKDRHIIGKWSEPERVRSKNHRSGQHVLLFRYAEPA